MTPSYSCYLIINKTNGKCYVGQTSKPVEHRWKQHIKDAKYGITFRLYNAMRKYGFGLFYVHTLRNGLTRKQADNIEKVSIILFKTTDENFGYNMTPGGDGSTLLKEARQKVADAAKIRWALYSPEQRKAIAKKGWNSKTLEQRQKLQLSGVKASAARPASAKRQAALKREENISFEVRSSAAKLRELNMSPETKRLRSSKIWETIRRKRLLKKEKV